MYSGRDTPKGWVSPFGHPRINDRSHLPAAFRSVPRPSSPLGAKASTRCPCFPPPPPATTTDHPTRSAIVRGPRPASAQRLRETGTIRGGGRRRRIPATTIKGPSLRGTARIPMPDDVPATRRKDQQKAGTSTCRCPSRTTHEPDRSSSHPQRAPHHHLTMSKQQRPATALACESAGTPGGPGPT